MQLVVTAAEVVVGDRIPTPEDDGPAVQSITGPEPHDTLGEVLAFTVDGEEQPRHMTPDLRIVIARPDPEETP